MEKRAIVSKPEAITPEGATSETRINLPLVLQYFIAIGSLTESAQPDRMGYVPVNLYASGEDQPRIRIIRHLSSYKDGATGFQDEIILKGLEDRLQLSAERNPQGEYSKYPDSLPQHSMHYINALIDTFTKLVQKEGSHVMISGQTAFVAHDGKWISVKVKKTKDSPFLHPSNRELPEENKS